MNLDLIVPSQIPWEEIKGKDLEELLYWLFDSMGAKDLDWRRGGKGGGAADQGRDLECSFYMSSPEGILVKQKWWVEGKGRNATVEPSDVKESVLNVSGKQDVDVFVLATNSQFSNPTRDWLKEWQYTHRQPIIRLWEKEDLERLLSKHPLAVIRLYRKALSHQGKLEVARTRFWNYATFTDGPSLEELWTNRNELEISAEALLAIVASEFANGDIYSRSWAASRDKELLIETTVHGLLNIIFFIIRANDAGTRQEPFLKALSYLIWISIDKIGGEAVSRLLMHIWDDVNGIQYPKELTDYILKPVLNVLVSEIRDACTGDCDRVDTEPMVLTTKEIKSYWRRLHAQTIDNEEDKGILTFESFVTPCKIGLSLDKENQCPICFLDDPEKNIAHAVNVVETITRLRKTITNKNNS